MSLKALVWALEEQEIFCSSEKLVLIALANYANDSGKTYPEVSTLCRLTRLSDNTVRRCIKNLADAGIITDTLKRFGPTQQVKVWQLPESTWKTEDSHGGGSKISRRPPEDPRKTPGRPPEDYHHGEQTLEPSNLGTLNQSVAVAPVRRFSDGWIAAFKLKFGEVYRYQAKDGVQASRLLKDATPEEALETAKKAWSQTDERKFWNCVHRSRDVASFVSNYTKIRLELKAQAQTPTTKVRW